MKLRIKSDSIRYRLTRTDVKDLAAAGYIDDKVNFGGQSLSYAIQATEGDALKSTYENNKITLFMPQSMISELKNTDKVGFENSSGALHLLVEKDFTCLDNVAEDQSDNYPNPLAENYYEKRD
ncbi:MAG: hypothetical protein JWR12_1377 [Mucilaginibacter sp.]|nr:hypothetical protein [Mucilaginibacter sp.]